MIRIACSFMKYIVILIVSIVYDTKLIIEK